MLKMSWSFGSFATFGAERRSQIISDLLCRYFFPCERFDVSVSAQVVPSQLPGMTSKELRPAAGCVDEP